MWLWGIFYNFQINKFLATLQIPGYITVEKTPAESRGINLQIGNNQNLSEKGQKFEYLKSTQKWRQHLKRNMGKCTNFKISSLAVSHTKSRVSEFLMKYGSRRLRSRLHHCQGALGPWSIHLIDTLLPPILPTLQKGYTTLSERGDITATQTIFKQLMFGYLSSILAPFRTVFGYFR